jgi:tetratricopeptide (TPR) repeat protein
MTSSTIESTIQANSSATAYSGIPSRGPQEYERSSDVSDAYKTDVQSATAVKSDAETLLLTEQHQAWLRRKEYAEYCRQEGDLGGAREMWFSALDEAQNLSAHIQWQSLDSLASSCLDCKQYDQAEAYGKRAVELAKLLSLDPRCLASSLNTVSGAYYYQRRFAEAEPISTQILTIYNKKQGREHVDVGMAASNLAMIYHAQGKFDLAVMLYERAVEISTKILGPEHPTVIELIANHAVALAASRAKEQLKKASVQHLEANDVVSALSNELWKNVTS